MVFSRNIKRVLFAGLIISLAPTILAQVIKRNIEVDFPWGHCKGTFEFETLPAPLQPTVVNFTLEATGASDGPWEITLPSVRQQLRWLGDTVFTWTGPIEIGDRFIGRLEFVPLVTGRCGFGFMFNGRGGYGMLSDYPLQWFFSLEGELIGLGNIKTDRFKGPEFRTTFFSDDSVFIPGFKGKRPFETFHYSIIVKPTLKINDTSTVTFRLVPLVDFSSLAVLEVFARGMTVIQPPRIINEPIVQSVPFEVEMQVVPGPVRILNQLSLSIIDPSAKKDDPRGQQFTVTASFYENGSLRLVNEGFEMELRKMLMDSLPSSFREYDMAKDQTNLRIVPAEYENKN